MNPIKIAVLEDDQRFLKDLIESLKKTKLVDDKNIIYNQNSDDFIEEVLKNDIDVLLLDIKLEGDIRNGIDVANILKKPTIFFTSARNEYTDKIEALKISKEFPPVEEFNKSPDVERLKTILEKFIPRVTDFQKSSKIRLKSIGGIENCFSKSDVAFIYAENGNHKIYFKNKVQIEVVDKNFDYFIKDLGFDNSSFYKVGRKHLVSLVHGQFEMGKIIVYYTYDSNQNKKEEIEIPRDRLNETRKAFQK